MIARYKIIVLVTVWAAAIGFGVHALMAYKGTPGDAGQPPKKWPGNELLAAPANKPALVMFAHPQCPCTKASLGELELLVAQAKDNFEATVLFCEPPGWANSASVKLARSIPGVRVLQDKEGRVAQRFQALTSGHTVVYNQRGKLIFSGGITGSRGHLGDNTGFDSVLKLVNNPSASPSRLTTEVFGCGLFDQCNSSLTTEAN